MSYIGEHFFFIKITACVPLNILFSTSNSCVYRECNYLVLHCKYNVKPENTTVEKRTSGDSFFKSMVRVMNTLNCQII